MAAQIRQGQHPDRPDRQNSHRRHARISHLNAADRVEYARLRPLMVAELRVFSFTCRLTQRDAEMVARTF